MTAHKIKLKFNEYWNDTMHRSSKGYHRRCFKCSLCNRSLDSTEHCDAPDKDIYCRRNYKFQNYCYLLIYVFNYTFIVCHFLHMASRFLINHCYWLLLLNVIGSYLLHLPIFPSPNTLRLSLCCPLWNVIPKYFSIRSIVHFVHILKLIKFFDKSWTNWHATYIQMRNTHPIHKTLYTLEWHTYAISTCRRGKTTNKHKHLTQHIE